MKHFSFKGGTSFGMSGNLFCKPNFDEIHQSAAELLLHLLSENVHSLIRILPVSILTFSSLSV